MSETQTPEDHLRPVPLTFKLNGWTYRQLKREGRIVLYSQGMTAAYEVHIIRFREPRLIHGKPLPAQEQLRSSEEFGRSAWTFPTLKEAEAKMAALVLTEQEKAGKSARPHKGEATLSAA